MSRAELPAKHLDHFAQWGLRARIFLALLLTTLAACGSGPNYRIYTLPNGKQVKVIGIARMYSTNGKNKWLILDYQTDLPIDDVPALRKEADEIWPHFKVDVERAGMDEAAIKASMPPKGFILQTTTSHMIAYRKSPDGRWSRLSD